MNSNTLFCKTTIHENHFPNKSTQLTKVYPFYVEDKCGERKYFRVFYFIIVENENFYEFK